MLAFWSPGWTIGGCLVATAVALTASRPLARATGLARWAAAAYLLGAGVSLAVTISPRSAADTYFVFESARRSCELIPWRRDPTTVVTSAEWLFNLLLFVPLGFLSRCAPHRRPRRALLAAGLTIPIFIEAVQYAAPGFYRVCQGLDVVTNWLGMLAGYGAAALVARARPATRNGLLGGAGDGSGDAEVRPVGRSSEPAAAGDGQPSTS